MMIKETTDKWTENRGTIECNKEDTQDIPEFQKTKPKEDMAKDLTEESQDPSTISLKTTGTEEEAEIEVQDKIEERVTIEETKTTVNTEGID